MSFWQQELVEVFGLSFQWFNAVYSQFRCLIPFTRVSMILANHRKWSFWIFYLTLSRRQTKVTIFGQVERRNSWMLYWHQNSQNHASRTSIMTLILTLCHKSIHRWNQLCKGFIWVTLNGSLVWCITDFWVYVYVFLRKELVPHIVWNPTITPQNDVCPLQQ